MVDLVAGNFVQVTIDGTDRTDHVISYNRYSSLCELGDSYELVISSDYPATLDPYQSIIITEWYDGASDVVLRGYILSIDQDFDGEFRIVGQDKSILLFDYFIPSQIKSEGESVDYWIQWYADQVGLAIDFQANSANTIVEVDTFMGLQTAGQGILTLERLAAYYIRFDSDQDKLIAYRLGSSNPAITINDIEEAKRTLGTEKTRNVVKVYGGYKYSFIPGEPPERIFAEARSVVPGLLVDKTVVVNSPGLRKQTYVDIVADRILNTVNSIDDVQLYSVPELIPDLEVGQVASINVSYSPHITYDGDREITSIEAAVGEQGATTIIGIGEKCARISIEFPTPPVYATTTDDGVAVSWNAGDNFGPSNTGLTASGLIGKNIGVNSYGQQMLLTAAGIYRRPSSLSSWVFMNDAASLPDPVNDSNDQPSGVYSGDLTLIRIVDEPTNRNIFHLLANGTSLSGGLGRSWVYTTIDFGNSWNSSQLYVTTTSGEQDHPFAPSGVSYDVYGHDLFSGIDNSTFTLITSTADFFTEGIEPDKIYWAGGSSTPSNRAWVGLYDGTSLTESTSYDFTVGDAHAATRIYSLPENRDVCFVVHTSAHNPSSEREYFVTLRLTKDGGLTWDTLIDNVSFYSGSFQGPPENEPHDYGVSIYIDYASTETEFRAVVTGVTHDAGSPLADASFRGFFINANSETEEVSYSIVTELIEIRGFTGEGIYAMSNNSRASHSTDITGTNYAFLALYGANAIFDEEPKIVEVQYNLVVARFNMTAQIIEEVVNIKIEKDDDGFNPSAAYGGVFSADGGIPFCFTGYRETVGETHEGTEIFYRGSSPIYTAGFSDSKWFPNGLPFATGTGGAIAFAPGLGKTLYSSGAFVSNTALPAATAIKEHQGPFSTQVWYIRTDLYWLCI